MSDDGTTDADELYYVVDESEFEDVDRVIVDVKGREIAVFRVDDEYFALSNYCVHQGGPACEGLLSGGLSVDERMGLDYDFENRIVACPWHGWEFDVETGHHLARPKYRLPTYEVVVRDGAVYLDV